MVKKYNIVGQDFSINLSDRYDLSILIGMDRFFYAVRLDNQVLALRTHHFPAHNYLQIKTAFEHVFQSDKLLKLNYRNTRIGLLTPIATLIPSDLYDTGQRRFYLEQNAILDKQHHVLNDALESVGAQHVYAFHSEIFECVQAQFPQAVFCNVLSGLITTHQRYGKPETVYANLTGEYLQIVVFNHKKLLFSNTFTHRSASDVLYFIMLVIKQLDLDAEQNKLILSGEITTESSTYTTLQQYIKHIEFVNTPNLYTYKNINAPDYHRFFDVMKCCSVDVLTC